MHVDMSVGVLGEVCLCAASLEPVDNGKVLEPLAVDFGKPGGTKLVVWNGRVRVWTPVGSGAPCDILLPSGILGHGECCVR
jgi:hypothetical protein